MGMRLRKSEDLAITDQIAANVLKEMANNSPPEIKQQMLDNIRWIEQAGMNKMVVGSKSKDTIR